MTAAIAGLAREDIKLPSSKSEVNAAQVGFYAIARFLISAVDCTHVRVQSFGGDVAEVFRNRKGYFSINVQATCDSSMKFTSIVARRQEQVMIPPFLEIVGYALDWKPVSSEMQ